MPPIRVRNEKGEVEAVIIDFNDNGLLIRVKVPIEVLHARAATLQMDDYVTCTGDAAKFRTSRNDFIVVMACSYIMVHNKIKRSWHERNEKDYNNSITPQVTTEEIEL